jgi:RHS repeat-associated protein
VKKYVPSTGEVTIFVYDAASKQIAEYSTIVAPQQDAKVAYLTNDHLGSPRINTDANGAVTARHDYHPFGEEIATAQRTAGLGYVDDTVRKQFTGYERDNETALDFARARYLRAGQGRFTSPDPLQIEKRHLADPRDLNRYVYVANNPLNYIDPTGEEKIRIIIRTFIPAKTGSVPGTKIVGGRPPRLLPTMRTFKGDDRKLGDSGSYRTQQVITIETDPRKNGGSPIYGSPEKAVGPTVEVNSKGERIRSAEATGNTLKAEVSRDDSGVVNVQASGNESNPLIASPGITYNFNIAVQSEGATGNAYYVVTGEHDGYPGYEVIIERPETKDKNGKLVYGHDPRATGQTPGSLFPPSEFPVNAAAICDKDGQCKRP